MNRTFTIDEDIIRRLMLRQRQEETNQAHRRLPLFRFWHGAPNPRQETAQLLPRARWS
jgi:hypothetical protein